MDYTQIIVAILSVLGVGLGSFLGLRKTETVLTMKVEQIEDYIKKNGDNIGYRVGELEKKIDKHNGAYDKMNIMEHQMNAFMKTLEAINTNVVRQSEQIDNVYSEVEKQEGRISLIEKSIISKVGGH